MALEHQDSHAEEYSSGTGDQITANQSAEAPSSIPTTPAVVQSPQTPDSNHKSSEKHDWHKDITLVVEVLGLAALIVYTVFSILQWAQIRYTNRLTARALDESDKSLTETLIKMQGQIDAANTANSLSKQSIVASQSASVITESPMPAPLPSDIELVRHQGLYIYFANVGKSKTGHYEAVATMTKVSLPNFRTIGTPQQKSVSGNQMKPVEQLLVGTPGFRTDDVHIGFDTSGFTEEDMRHISTTDEAIEIRGHTEYGDGFGNDIKQPFCFIYAAFPRHVFVKSGAATGEGGSWGMCTDMRKYITEASNWKTGSRK